MLLAVLMMPRHAQLSAAVLSTNVAIFSSGTMRGEKCGGGLCMTPAPGH